MRRCQKGGKAAGVISARTRSRERLTGPPPTDAPRKGGVRSSAIQGGRHASGQRRARTRIARGPSGGVACGAGTLALTGHRPTFYRSRFPFHKIPRGRSRIKSSGSERSDSPVFVHRASRTRRCPGLQEPRPPLGLLTAPPLPAVQPGPEGRGSRSATSAPLRPQGGPVLLPGLSLLPPAPPRSPLPRAAAVWLPKVGRLGRTGRAMASAKSSPLEPERSEPSTNAGCVMQSDPRSERLGAPTLAG